MGEPVLLLWDLQRLNCHGFSECELTNTSGAWAPSQVDLSGHDESGCYLYPEK